MKKLTGLALGIMVSIGGYLDVGTIATSSDAGASFGFLLLWALLVGTICVILLTEMTGRLAAVSHQPLASAIRERLGMRYFVIPLIAEIFVDFLLLGAEIGGTSLALQLLTGIHYSVWALPVAFVVWVLLWLGNFDIIQNGVSMLGLVTVVFLVAAVVTRPSVTEIVRGFLPALPKSDVAHYLFIAVSMIGSTLTPYLFYLYSTGAVEDKWTEKDLSTNRITAIFGMAFGGLMAMAIVVVAGAVLHPLNIQIDNYNQVAIMLTQPFGLVGFILFAASLAIACFSTALGVGLNIGYIFAQGAGWNWSENAQPKKMSRFVFVYTIFVFLPAFLMLIGIDPLQLTLLTMALAVVVLPLVVAPLLILMNDRKYVGKFHNGLWMNTAVIVIVLLSFVLAVVAIPLEIFGA